MRTGLRELLFVLLAAQLAAVAVWGQDGAEMKVEIRKLVVGLVDPILTAECLDP